MSNQRVNAPITASRAAEGVYTPPFQQAVFTPYATPSIYGSPTAARESCNLTFPGSIADHMQLHTRQTCVCFCLPR